MINQSSIKYISSLLNRPDSITDGDHSSVALFRQTFPYFVPTRYIQAAESHKKVAFSPKMISEIQPYMGNWILLCNFLEAGRKAGRQGSIADNKPEQKEIEAIQPAAANKPVMAEEKKPAQKMPGFMQQTNAGQQKPPVAPEVKVTRPVAAEVKAEQNVEPVKPVMAEVKVPPVVIPEIKVETKVEEVKPVISSVAEAMADKAEVKVPPVVVPEIKVETKVEEVKPIISSVAEAMADKAEVKVTPVVVPVVKVETKVEEVKPAIAEVKAPPVVIPEVKVETKVEEVKPVISSVAEATADKAEVKIPPVVIPEIKVEEVKPVIAEVKVPPFVVPEIKAETKVEEVKPVISSFAEATADKAEVKVPPFVVPEIKAETKVEPVKPIIAEVKAPPVVVPEIKVETKVEEAKPVVAEVKVPPVVVPEIKAEKEKEKEGAVPAAPTKEEQEVLTHFIPAKVIIKKQIEVAEEVLPVAAKQKEALPIPPVSKEAVIEDAEEIVHDEEKDKLIQPVYTEDYFLQQGVKVSIEIPEEIEEFKEVVNEEAEEGKDLMVMMSFSEWLLHFKNTAEKQKDERKDQKALKTMWQKEKLAAAMEEENEEIPENVFEMAVNSITKEDGLASESLADIYIKQGKYDQAIEMYRKLSLRNPKKNAYFARRIEEVLKEKQS